MRKVRKTSFLKVLDYPLKGLNCVFVEFVSDLSCGFVGFGVFVSFVLCALFVGLVSDFGVCGGADVFRAAARVPSKKFPKKNFLK